MKRTGWMVMLAVICSLTAGVVVAEAGDADLMAEAAKAGPSSVTDNATFKSADGRVLKKGSNDYTCYPQQDIIGPMCNPPEWDALIGAMLAKEPFDADKFSVSYMLAGEGTALGVSNIDPYETAPTDDNQWVKEGPHLMIIVPDEAMLEGLSTDPSDPVYVMWKGTPYAHVMVKISAE